MVEDEDETLIQYQFKVPQAKWIKWKKTVPRTKKLDERIIELLEEDSTR